MRKKIGFESASLSVSSPDGKELEPKLQELIRSYANERRQRGFDDSLDFIVFMLYCSYISRNTDDFGLADFDLNYSVDEVGANLGNVYLATEFVSYYAELYAQNPNLPDLCGISLDVHDLSRAIASWSVALDASGLSLMEGCNGEAASAIRSVLVEMLTSDAWGKRKGEFSSSPSVAEAATRIVDVEGKTVLDFACGNGIYLAAALSKGASFVCGRDIDNQAVMRAKIVCFFANPMSKRDIAVADALTAASTTAPAQRVFVAPPFGVRLRDFDIREKGYCADVMNSAMGDDAAQASSLEDFCIAKALVSLADDGIAVLHVSASFLFHQQKGRQLLRSALVEKGYLRTVVELPGGCVPGVTVKSALLVIAKQPSDEGVLLVDFDSKELDDKGYVAKSRGRCEITEPGIAWLTEVIRNRDEVSLVSTVVDREKILASGGSLCYSAYGDVFDYESILEKIRPSKDIMKDICAVQASIDSLGEQIAGILDDIEREG